MRDEFPAVNFSRGRQVGFIAQETAGVLPEAVTTDAKGYNSDPAPVCRITNVASNDPAVEADWQVTGLLTLDLRALRLGAHTGREYIITVTCTNSSELSSSAAVTVRVPHDQRK